MRYLLDHWRVRILEAPETIVGRFRCLVLHRHNVTCRGRTYHYWRSRTPHHYSHGPGPNGCGRWG